MFGLFGSGQARFFKRLAQVFNDVFHIFNADAETEEAVVEFFRIEALPLVVFA